MTSRDKEPSAKASSNSNAESSSQPTSLFGTLFSPGRVQADNGSIFQGENRLYNQSSNAINLSNASNSSAQDVDDAIPRAPANIQANHQVDVNCADDGYPLISADLQHSDRQQSMLLQRQIDQVIDQQQSPHLMSTSSSANHIEAQSNEGSSSQPNVTVDDRSWQAAEEAKALLEICRHGAVAASRSSTTPTPTQEDAPRAVNILPASKSLIDNPNNLIAIGRKSTFSASGDGNRIGNRNTPIKAGDAASTLGWQAAKSNLKERIQHMYLNDTLADVYFLVGKEGTRERIPAHKFVLSIGSVVFDAMFNGGLTPQNRDPLEIELPDVEASAFLTLLKFLYTDEVNIGPESVMTTLYTAKKYAVPAMETSCVEFLKQSLGADNAFMLLSQARLFDEYQLEDLCLDLIDKNTHEALNGEGFTEIDHTTLCLVLKRDTLRIREAVLFQATLKWAREECQRRKLLASPENQRQVLGSAIDLIRFPVMSVEDFAQFAAQSGVLTDREVVTLFLYFTVTPKPPVSWSDARRNSMSGKESIVSRFQRTEQRWGYTGTSDRIKFTVDRRIFVVGLGLFGSVHGPHEYNNVLLKLIHCGTGNSLADHETSFLCDGTPQPNRVFFKQPVEILPGVTYIASATIKGPDSFYGTKGLRRIVDQSSDVTFQFTYAAANNNGTSVEDGQIPEIIFFVAP